MTENLARDGAAPFPWKQAMQFGFGVMHLAPRDFWSMSVRELEAAMQAHFGDGSSVTDRTWLEKAMRDNPDGKVKDEG